MNNFIEKKETQKEIKTISINEACAVLKISKHMLKKKVSIDKKEVNRAIIAELLLQKSLAGLTENTIIEKEDFAKLQKNIKDNIDLNKRYYELFGEIIND